MSHGPTRAHPIEFHHSRSLGPQSDREPVVNRDTIMCRMRRHDSIHINSTVSGQRDPNRIVNRDTTICRTGRHDLIYTKSPVVHRSARPHPDREHMTTTMSRRRGHDPILLNSTVSGHRRECKKRRRRGGKNRNSIKLFAVRKLLRANVSFYNQTNGRKNAPV